MLSININLKNRTVVKVRDVFYDKEVTLYPLWKCLFSLDFVIGKLGWLPTDYEINILDWNSTDYPIEKTRQRFSNLNIHIYKKEGIFNRGEGKNLLGNISNGDILLFLDADMLVGGNLLREGLSRIGELDVLFLTCHYFLNPTHTMLGDIIQTAVGNLFIRKNVFSKLRGFREYREWGKDDTEFFCRVRNIPYLKWEVDYIPELYHQWHPTEKKFKDREIKG